MTDGLSRAAEVYTQPGALDPRPCSCHKALLEFGILTASRRDDSAHTDLNFHVET